MTRYFAQNTPRAGLEHMMMSVPGFQKRGGGMMILSRFCYKPEDVDCRYCLHYRRRSCQVRTCPYIAERLKSGAIEYLDLILEYFGHIPHAGLHKRIQAVEHWSGPDQAVLHTVSVHLRSRFADRVWDDAPPGYLAALYLLASKERLWQPALPALSHDSIDFSRIVSKPHGFAIQDALWNSCGCNSISKGCDTGWNGMGTSNTRHTAVAGLDPSGRNRSYPSSRARKGESCDGGKRPADKRQRPPNPG